MNNEINTHQRAFFPLNTGPLKIQKAIKKVNQVDKNAVYNLTWDNFYQELHQSETNDFIKKYRFSSKKNLQLFIAKSNLWQEKITLLNFETSTQTELIAYLGDKFFAQVSLAPNFNPRNHKLSTIHHFIYHYKLSFAALSLGFCNLQTFLNFFARSSFVPDWSVNKAKTLSIAISVLQKAHPAEMRNELAQLYDRPLLQNTRFKKYDYTFGELKFALEKENLAMIIASLGGDSSHRFNSKLKGLRPFIDVQLEHLKEQSREELSQNIPSSLWDVKLYQLFSQKKFFRKEGIFKKNSIQQFYRSQPEKPEIEDPPQNAEYGQSTSTYIPS